MFDALLTDQLVLGSAIGVVFDDLGKRIVAARLGTVVDDDCEDDTTTGKNSTNAHADTVDYFLLDVDAGADDEDAP